MSKRFLMGIFGRVLWFVAGTGGLAMVWFGDPLATRAFGNTLVQLASVLPLLLRRLVQGPGTAPVSWGREIVVVILVLLMAIPLGIYGYSLPEQKGRLLLRLILTGLWIGSLASEGVHCWRWQARKVAANLNTHHGTDLG